MEHFYWLKFGGGGDIKHPSHPLMTGLHRNVLMALRVRCTNAKNLHEAYGIVHNF